MNPVFDQFIPTGNANLTNSFGQKSGWVNDISDMNAAELAQLQKDYKALVRINNEIEKNPGYDGNINNRACIYCLKGDKIHALEDLVTAVSKMPQLKQHAREDEDFKSIWDDADFKKITQ